MSPVRGFLSIVVLAGVCAGTATAIDRQIIAAETGKWFIAPENGRPGCHVTLTNDSKDGGYSIGSVNNCIPVLPVFSQITAWNFADTGDLYMVDARKNELLRFKKEKNGLLRSNNDPSLLILKAPDGLRHLPYAERLTGRWKIRNGAGQRLCTLTLGMKADDTGFLEASPDGDCASGMPGAIPLHWRIEAFSVILKDANDQILTFAMHTDDGTDRDMTDDGQTYHLVRS